jgi:hypothetical protein
MKRHHLYALLGVSFALHANAQTPPPPAPVVASPAMAPALAPAHPATESSNANPFKPKEMAAPTPGAPPSNQPTMPMPMPMAMQAPMPGPNGESPKKLGSMNGVTAYRGTDTSYQFIQGPNQ